MTKKPPHHSEPITFRALVQRLKRRHARDGETFRVTRGDRWYSDLGRWHTVENNVLRNAWHNVDDLVEHARDIGVLGAHEMATLDQSPEEA